MLEYLDTTGKDYRIAKAIEEIALTFQATFDIVAPISNIEPLIYTRLRGQIVNGNTFDIAKNGGTFIICCPSNAPIHKVNFEVAKLLGKILLHYGYLTDNTMWESISDNTFKLPYKNMREVDYCELFALCFLMPTAKVISQVNNLQNGDGSIDLKSLAQYFCTSTYYLKERLFSIGYRLY